MSILFLALGVIDAHVLLHAAVGNWIWPTDAAVCLLLVFLGSIGDQIAPSFTSRVIRDIDNHGGKADPVGEYGRVASNPLSALRVALALVVIRVGLGISFHGTGWLMPLLPLLLLSAYFLYRLLDHGNIFSWGLKLVETSIKGQSIWYILGAALLLLPQLAAVLAIAFEFFAGWTAYGARIGAVPFDHKVTGIKALDVSEHLYLWNLLDSVPALRIPYTIRLPKPWEPADWRCGLLIVSFRALVLLPLIGGVLLFVRAIWERLTRDLNDEVSQEDGDWPQDHRAATRRREQWRHWRNRPNTLRRSRRVRVKRRPSDN